MFLNINSAEASSDEIMEAKMKLYYSETMNPRRACSVAKYLGSPVELVHVNLGEGEHKRPEFLARNPCGRVPVLEDGTKRLWESTAIMVQLATSAGSELWPARDPVRQVEVMRWLSWDLCHWAPRLGQFYFEYLIKKRFGMGEVDQAALARETPELHASAQVLDAHLARHEYLASDRLSIADFSAGVLLPYAEECALPLSGYTNIQRWYAQLCKLDGYLDPWPASAPARA